MFFFVFCLGALLALIKYKSDAAAYWKQQALDREPEMRAPWEPRYVPPERLGRNTEATD